MAKKANGDVVIRVVGLPGSIRPGSYTRMAVETALRGAREVGCVTALIDLREYMLSFAGAGDEGGSGAEKLRAEVKQADGLILGTPEYHNSFSGVLKNALDLMGFDEFEGKMIGLVGVSGGLMGAFDALNSLRNIGRALHAWVVPEQASVPEAWKVFDKAGGIQDARLEQRLLEVGRQVGRFARLHKCAQAGEFLKDWEAATPNPGG
jgi:NAD(P)H-dependent FMN reductase